MAVGCADVAYPSNDPTGLAVDGLFANGTGDSIVGLLSVRLDTICSSLGLGSTTYCFLHIGFQSQGRLLT